MDCRAIHPIGAYKAKRMTDIMEALKLNDGPVVRGMPVSSRGPTTHISFMSTMMVGFVDVFRAYLRIRIHGLGSHTELTLSPRSMANIPNLCA